jgi:cellulase/cellobiase CelA1
MIVEITVSKQTTKKTSAKTTHTTDAIPKTVMPNPKTVQKAIDQIANTLNNPEYKDQLTKLTQASVNNTVQTAQRLSKASARMSKLNNEEMTELVSNSVSDMMRLYIQFNTELLTLVQKVSNRAVDILEKATPTTEETTSEQSNQ